MIEKFENGHWYRYLEKRQITWNEIGLMDYVIGGRPVKCYIKNKSIYLGGTTDGCLWEWGDLTDWHKSDLNVKLDKILRE